MSGPGAQQVSMVSRPSLAQWLCEVLCVAIAVVGPTMVTPEDRGGLGMRVRFGCVPWCMCVVAVMGLCDRRVGAAWRHTPVNHDGTNRQPNRSAFTLTGPSQNVRCWFGKGTQVSIRTELFADVPLLFPSFGLLVGLV